MKLDCVVTACNTNLLYMDCIPYFIKIWNKLYPLVDIKIIFINDKIPDSLQKYKKNLILYKPPENISTAFISQYIRLLYPAILNYQNGVMITDIDNVPLNNKFFTDNIKSFQNDKWINLRDWMDIKGKNPQICMMWQIACPNIWKTVFKINSIKDITDRLIEKNKEITYIDGHNNSGWCTDQIDLYKYVMSWNETSKNYIKLYDKYTKHNRLDREDLKKYLTKKNIKRLLFLINKGFFTDYHILRPYTKYKQINDLFFKNL